MLPPTISTPEAEKTSAQARRSGSSSAALAKAARILVAPFVEQMTEWQFKAARADAALRSSHADRREAASLSRGLEALSNEVRTCAIGLDEAASLAPPNIAAHGRVTDVRNALAALRARIDSALALAISLDPG